ncbi:MAG: FAD-dependent oxidoreductase [Sphingomonas bacterium]|nr:FAD-dependent oxidoreductase [Sphingomonas bacterium]
MKSDVAEADVMIVGGGFSGTMMAAQLARRGLKVVLVEGGGRAGQGTAYSTRAAVDLLNVPAAKMSAWPDRPDDFVAAGHAAGAFAPRRDFGVYLRSILDLAVAEGVVLVAASAVSAVRSSKWRVTLDDGLEYSARALVLAQGNQPPEPMRVGEGIDPALFINNPWGDEARAAIARVAREDGDVLILGTGLTMVDQVLSLDAAGHRGKIVALSRRGQMPRGHAAHDLVPVELADVPQNNVLALWRWLRRRSAMVGWRGAVDSLRPHAQALWRGLSDGEQRRFLRHARPYWDVHRHRIAPQVAEQLQAMIAEGRLEVAAGRVRAVRALATLRDVPSTGSVVRQDERDVLMVEIARRGDRSSLGPSREREVRFAAVFNCTGPLGAMGRTRDGLLRQMIEAKLVAVDRLGMGLAVDGASRAGERVWALGPLTKGAFWEIVAVPDIRHQVAQVADQIAKELSA